MRTLRNVTLEMSLKPFKRVDPGYIDTVCRKVFHQWMHLIDRSDMVSVLLWVADGSEILDYRGKLDDEIEWARYLGTANSRAPKNLKDDPELRGLHSRPYLYMDDPPTITFSTLRHIVGRLRAIGAEMTGKAVRVGETFDPGPEFAKSPFKYDRHLEICSGGYHGVMSFAYCYATLHADDVAYAGFPDGIAEGTPLGRFLGRQSRIFLDDMGFDYLWFSNGFGFGAENWGSTGVIFDGAAFHQEAWEPTRAKVLDFWREFRDECPDYPIETRGTNLSTGIDLAGDAVPLGDIYRGGFDMLPPPNSPWAALNGDFGLELTGFLSRMAELPGEVYPYRFYVHDPWWLNSPWLDRYGREPHDIYLPLACARVNARGEVVGPSDVQFLTIDDSLGDMPDRCPNEVVPHILAGIDDGPDDAPPFLWVYPFDDYHRMMGEPGRASEVFAGDWFIRAAINDGFPLCGVVSTGNFASLTAANPDRFASSVIVATVPDAGSEADRAIVATVGHGGRVLLYGPIAHASAELLELLGLSVGEPVAGVGEISVASDLDRLERAPGRRRINHRDLTAGGGIRAVAAAHDAGAGEGAEVLATGVFEGQERALAVFRATQNGGCLGWTRGTVSAGWKEGEYLLVPDDPESFYPAEELFRLLAERAGYGIGWRKPDATTRSPVITVHRNRGGMRVSMYAPETVVGVDLRFPLGAPLLEGLHTRLESGRSTYHPPRFWTRECRVFVEQESGVVHTRRMRSSAYRIVGRMSVSGLKDATVRFLPEPGFEDTTTVLLNTNYPWMVGDPLDLRTVRDPKHGTYLEARNVTGELIYAW
jgi:hypothetical protein